MYAILDIETTGGQFNEEGITEIAVYRFDGHEIVDQFISLVNPEIPIQPFVVKLTGINNSMLKSAPKFHEVAKRIVEITQDCILVAHNASFDFRILRTEFRRLGYDFRIQTLCTVELAQKLIPDQPSYSLGKLVRGLGIPIADRHRANGDALATLKLFQLLLDKDLGKRIIGELIKTEVEKGIEPKLLDLVESLPSRTGIYYVYKEDGTLLYIGRSRNMRKHLNQHFTGDSRISKRMQAEVFRVAFEETGSELIAQLKETEEIRLNRPPLNRKPRKGANRFWSLSAETDEEGYFNLFMEKSTGGNELAAFVSPQEGKNLISRVTADYHLCRKLNGLNIGDENGPCSDFRIGKCDGACIGKVGPEEYNERVSEFIGQISLSERSVVVVDRGRTVAERSAILVENGVLQGYAFFELNYQITNPSVLKNILIVMPHHRDTLHALTTYLIRNRKVKVVSLA